MAVRKARQVEHVEEEEVERKERSFWDTLRVWKYRYDLNTALYMLDPWERMIFNSIFLCILAYVVYGAYYRTLQPWIESIGSSV